MKNYFGFTLTGKKFLPVWLVFYFLFIVPYALLTVKMKSTQAGTPPSGMTVIFLLLLMLVAFIITFYLAKIMIENIQYRGQSVTFNGKIGKFVGVILGGLLLSIVTLGVYMAWFIRNLHRFFVNNSAFENESFTFRGKGGRLFVILLLTLFLPIILLTVIMVKVYSANPGQIGTAPMLIQQTITWIIMIPYMYLVYKWMVNISYKKFNIKWETNFWSSCGKLALEIFLTVITLGIYFPMAMIKLYHYFAERTIAQSEDTIKRFGFETDHINDFLFLWGQILLTLITVGFYYPWAISKIGTRIMGRTYLE